MSNRFSVYSSHSAGFSTSGARSAPQTTQVSTTTLLNALHAFYNSGQSYQLDAGTSLVVNSWATARHTTPDGRTGGTIDRELAIRAWEHARRRAEDGCIVLWFEWHPFLVCLNALWVVANLRSALLTNQHPPSLNHSLPPCPCQHPA